MPYPAKQSAGLASATLRKYCTFTSQIITYAASRGYVMLDQITPADIELEINEPFLYIGSSSGAAKRFADAIVRTTATACQA